MPMQISEQYLQLECDLPEHLVLGRKYYIGETGHIIIDFGNGPITFGKIVQGVVLDPTLKDYIEAIFAEDVADGYEEGYENWLDEVFGTSELPGTYSDTDDYLNYLVSNIQECADFQDSDTREKLANRSVFIKTEALKPNAQGEPNWKQIARYADNDHFSIGEELPSKYNNQYSYP